MVRPAWQQKVFPYFWPYGVKIGRYYLVQDKIEKTLKPLQRNTFWHLLNSGDTRLDRFKSGCHLQSEGIQAICLDSFFFIFGSCEKRNSFKSFFSKNERKDKGLQGERVYEDGKDS